MQNHFWLCVGRMYNPTATRICLVRRTVTTPSRPTVVDSSATGLQPRCTLWLQLEFHSSPLYGRPDVKTIRPPITAQPLVVDNIKARFGVDVLVGMVGRGGGSVNVENDSV
ncbi:hypothetical protein J6590_034207 [Homalodisca vitripennis]|nr:hypothetical protein J6590_034207 [Homalodisca vitripennis]